jgi:enoyl-CoA hydratase
MTSHETVLLTKEAGIATVTLNRPEQRNALNSAMRTRLGEVLRELAQSDDVGVVIFTGAGKAFCAGIDLKELGGEVKSEASLTSAVTAGPLTEAFAQLPQPLIAAVNGAAITGGFELVLACDLIVASSEARFADTHARVGILPGWGLSQRLSRTIGIYRAKELSLTGNYLSAEQAERWGLVNRVVPPEELLSQARALATDMLSCDSVALRKLKRGIDDGYALDFAGGMALEQERAVAHAKAFDPAQVAARRAEIQSRGRAQSDS